MLAITFNDGFGAIPCFPGFERNPTTGECECISCKTAAQPPGFVSCDPNTQYWDSDLNKCVPFPSDAAADAATTAATDYSVAASRCNPNTQYWDSDLHQCVAFPPEATTTTQKALIVAAQQQAAVTAAAQAASKKIPIWVWIAAATGGVILIGGVSYALFGGAPATASTIAPAVPAARAALGRKRRYRATR